MYDIFKTSIKVFNFNTNIEKIEQWAFNYESKGKIASNIGGHQSDYIDIKNNAILKDFVETVEHESKLFSKELGIHEANYLNSMWVNINDYGHTNDIHSHPKCLISGVFYPGTFYHENMGDLVFINPASDLLKIDYDFSLREYTNYNSPKWVIKPERGKVILFPSYLNHLVRPNLNKDFLRLSISFNLEHKNV